MTRRSSLRRTGAMLLAGALLFVLAGDRGITAVALGIDPLEVLDLQDKPNVIVALDTSGSMEDLTNNNASPYGGDHLRSKMYQAKQVLKAVFQAIQDKASFMFGVYRFSSPSDAAGNTLPYSTGTATVNSGSTTVNFGGLANIPGDVGSGDILVFPGAPAESFTDRYRLVFFGFSMKIFREEVKDTL